MAAAVGSLGSVVDDGEVMGVDDRLVDALFYPYVPAAPTVGKWPATRLLTEAADAVDRTGTLSGAVRRFRSATEANRTVWRLVDGPSPSLHLHWFRAAFAGAIPFDAVRACLDGVAGRVRLPAELDPSALFVELGPGTSSSIEVRSVRAAFGDADRPEAVVPCHELGHRAPALSEVLLPHVPDALGPVARSRVRSSPHGRLGTDDVLWDEFAGASASAIGYGPVHDTLYVVGLGLDAFRSFAARARMASALVDLLDRRASVLDHLRFDVSLSYRCVEGRVEVVDAGIMGVF